LKAFIVNTNCSVFCSFCYGFNVCLELSSGANWRRP